VRRDEELWALALGRRDALGVDSGFSCRAMFTRMPAAASVITMDVPP
jgi:hypothetical protein